MRVAHQGEDARGQGDERQDDEGGAECERV